MTTFTCKKCGGKFTETDGYLKHGKACHTRAPAGFRTNSREIDGKVTVQKQPEGEMKKWAMLSSKAAVSYWAQEAVERQYKNQSFTDQEVITIFGSMEKAFGQTEASGFLNLVKETVKRHNGRMSFNRAVVETIANHTPLGK